jgi:plasmid replication initiation protein
VKSSKIIKLGNLKKSTPLTHSSATLTSIQRKLINILLYSSVNTNERRERYTINIREIISLIDYNSHDYVHLKKSLIGLMSTVVELDVYADKTEADWSFSTMLSYVKAHRGGVLEYGFSPVILDLIFEPKTYARIDLDESLKLRSQYSLAMFELCSRFVDFKTSEIKISKIRKLLGVGEGKYTNFRDLRRRVIVTAVDEINLKTSLSIKYEVKYISNRAHSVQFFVQGKKQRLVEAQSSLTSGGRLLGTQKTHDIGVSDEERAELISKYGNNKVSTTILYTRGKMKSRLSPPRNPRKYFLSLLDKNINLSRHTQPTKIFNYDSIEKLYDEYVKDITSSWIADAMNGQLNNVWKVFELYLQSVNCYDFVISATKKSFFSRDTTSTTMLLDLSVVFERNEELRKKVDYTVISRKEWMDNMKKEKASEGIQA